MLRLASGGCPIPSAHCRSVHAAAGPVLRSVMLAAPSARARSPNRRSADQNATRHFGPQKRCGEPPRRARNCRSHQSHTAETASVLTMIRGRSVHRYADGVFPRVPKALSITVASTETSGSPEKGRCSSFRTSACAAERCQVSYTIVARARARNGGRTVIAPQRSFPCRRGD